MFKGKITGRKFFFVSAFSAVTLIASCSNDSTSKKYTFNSLDESLTNSSKDLKNSTQMIYVSLEDKITNPLTREKAELWLGKAAQVETLTNDIIKFISRLKSNAMKEKNLTNSEIAELHNNIKKYRDDILKIDAKINNIFSNSMILTTREFDSLNHDAEAFSKTFFDDLESEGILTMLSMFQNNIMSIENRLMSFCHNQTAVVVLDCRWIVPIVGQSSSYVQPGEKIEITAGIGEFTRKNKPEIKINNVPVPLNEYDLAILKFSASKIPGKYIVPVEVCYTNDEGLRQKITKNMEHTVAQTANK